MHEIEAFYRSAAEKVLYDEEGREAYAAFRKEWRDIRGTYA